MAILFAKNLCPTENIISELSFQSPFPWNFPAPTNLTLLFPTVHVLSPQPAIVDLLEESLQELGYSQML